MLEWQELDKALIEGGKETYSNFIKLEDTYMPQIDLDPNNVMSLPEQQIMIKYHYQHPHQLQHDQQNQTGSQ